MELITNEELRRMTKQIAEHDFHRPFQHYISFNPRLKTTGGRYFQHSHHIDINPKMVTAFTNLNVLEGVIKHELCHYFLDLTPGKDPKHGHDFKVLLHQVGGLRYAPNLERAQYQYICTNCFKHYPRKRKVNTNRYVCGRCQGKLKLIKMKPANHV